MNKITLKKRHRVETLTAILLLLIVIGILWLVRTIPPKDAIQSSAFPPEFSIDAGHNDIDLQTGNECSAYAAAYVMRHLGKQITGSELYRNTNISLKHLILFSISPISTPYGRGNKLKLLIGD